MDVLECFAGIGGNALAMASLGFRTAAYCESDAFSARVLRENMRRGRLHPGPVFPDIAKLRPGHLKAQKIGIVAAGFPCQGLSVAGRRAGLYQDARSQLVKHVYRLVQQLKPKLVFLENTPLLRKDANFADMLRKLVSLGYDRVAFVVTSASQVGAQHLRKRIFILAARRGLTLQGVPVRDNSEALRKHFRQRVVNVLERSDRTKNWERRICSAVGNCVVPLQAAKAFLTLRATLLSPNEVLAPARPLSDLQSVDPMRPTVFSGSTLRQNELYAVPDVRCGGRGFHVHPSPPPPGTRATRPLVLKPFFSQCFPTFRTHAFCVAPVPTMTERTKQDAGNFLVSSRELWRGNLPGKDVRGRHFVSDEYALARSGFPKSWLRAALVGQRSEDRSAK